MKNFAKIALTSAVILAGSSSFALAKTQGSYAGFSVHKASVEHMDQYRNGGSYTNKYGANKAGLGFDYKYAFNFGKVFVAPGVFVERIGTKGIDRNAVGNNVDIKFNNRYGAKFDLGYDISDNTGLYFTNGLAHVQYKLSHSDADGAGTAQVLNEGETAYFYGFGLMSHVRDDVTLGFEYNTQSFNTATLYNDTGFRPGERTKNKIDLYKFTVAYHF